MQPAEPESCSSTLSWLRNLARALGWVRYLPNAKHLLSRNAHVKQLRDKLMLLLRRCESALWDGPVLPCPSEPCGHVCDVPFCRHDRHGATLAVARHRS